MKTLICLFLMLAGLVFAVSLFTYSFLWYESAGQVRPFPERHRRFSWMMLRGILSGIVCLLFVVLPAYPLGLLRSLRRPRRISPSQPLIILTHGIFHNASAWILFRRRLLKAGFTNVFVMNYWSFFTTFERVLKKFEQFVRDAAMAVPGQPVFLVGHSLGGLLSRVYAERRREWPIPAAVITLGTPHQGSKMAAFGPGNLAASLHYQGPLFAELEREHRQLPCPGVAFCSPVDNLVLPPEGLKAAYGDWIYHETEPMSHVAMLCSSSTAQQVIRFIKSGSLSQ